MHAPKAALSFIANIRPLELIRATLSLSGRSLCELTGMGELCWHTAPRCLPGPAGCCHGLLEPSTCWLHTCVLLHVYQVGLGLLCTAGSASNSKGEPGMGASVFAVLPSVARPARSAADAEICVGCDAELLVRSSFMWW